MSEPLQLQEEEWSDFDQKSIPSESFMGIDDLYPSEFSTEYPSPRTGWKYRVRPSGHVGCFPVDDQLSLRVDPKVSIRNLFRMLEYAYQLDAFRNEGLVDVASIEDLFENLASILARRVNDRCRKGLSRDYILEEDDLQCIRGRFLFEPTLRHMVRGGITARCEFEEHTPDIDENRILAWVLHQLHRFPIGRDDVRREIRSAHQSLVSTVDLRRFPASACVGRYYDRLNADYEPMHALCRFFLEQLGPASRIGSHQSIPFRIQMPLLFERFVEKWLRRHLPPRFALDSQYTAKLDQEGQYTFRADLVLREAHSDDALAILDTKYKRDADIEENDRNQIFTYASVLRAPSCFLVYPSTATAKRRSTLKSVVIHSVVFDLSRDLEAAGEAFLKELLGLIPGEA